MSAAPTGKAAASLAGSTIWLTRPRYQLSGLTAEIEARGGRVQALPMFEIEALPVDQSLRQQLLDLDQYELLFFISTNAARLGMEAINGFWPQLPGHLQYFSVGPTTAEALADYDVRAQYPETGMSSEALLAMPALSDIDGRRALIFRGQGGREILAGGLREKGARVDYAEVYRRALPDYSEAYLRQCLQDARPDVLVVSSAEALDNLCNLLYPLWPELLQTDLMVSSGRLEEKAGTLGFNRIHNAEGANDPAIVAALESWHRRAIQ